MCEDGDRGGGRDGFGGGCNGSLIQFVGTVGEGGCIGVVVVNGMWMNVELL